MLVGQINISFTKLCTYYIAVFIMTTVLTVYSSMGVSLSTSAMSLEMSLYRKLAAHHVTVQ